MINWFLSLSNTDKIALCAFIVACYGAFLSTKLYYKEKTKIKLINLENSYLTFSPANSFFNDTGVPRMTYHKNLFALGILVRINNLSKNPVTITDFMLNGKYFYNNFTKDIKHFPISFEYVKDNLTACEYLHSNCNFIKPVFTIEPLSTCEGFILFTNLDKVPNKIKITVNTVLKAKTFKFTFKPYKDFRNCIKV